MDAPEVDAVSNDSEPFSDPRRRSPRVAHRVSLAATAGKAALRLESIIVNAHGALVESPASLQPGATLTVRNEALGTQAEAWVIWCGPGRAPGTFDVGLEFATPDPAFWRPRPPK